MRRALVFKIAVVSALWAVNVDAMDSVPPPSTVNDKALPASLLKKYEKPADDGKKQYWENEGQSELERVLTLELNTNRAKNVILFLGDGMGISSVTAGRIYKGQQRFNKSGEEAELTFDTFPHTALSKTYCVDRQVPDSACTGTAYLCGVKTNYQVVGADARAMPHDCASLKDDNMVYSIAYEAIKDGKKAGVVTSTRITHATPAAAYAHSTHRKFECDGLITDDMLSRCPNFKDIARQLVENEPGKKLSVIMGGGIQYLRANATNMTGDPVDPDDCLRKDNRNLMQEWLDEKEKSSMKAALVHSKTDLMELRTQDLDYLMGIFANGHLPYEYEKREKNLDVPTLAEMTKKAIEVLGRGDDGFFLLVEGGRIDHGHHKGIARRALDELLAFDDAVKVATEMLDLSETLIVVTADHSHVMTVNGYPKRGQDILGFAQVGDDKLPYTTIMYTNGPGFNYIVDNTGNVSRVNISDSDLWSYDFKQQSAMPADSETHAGEDVGIYAIGPMSHLFQGVHQQNYIAHAMSYAACVGKNKNHCSPKSAARALTPVWALVVLVSLYHVVNSARAA